MATRSANRVRGQRPEHWASLHPDQPAIVGGGSVLSYRAWNQLADQLADSLAQRRIRPGVAAVALTPHPDWFVINLALAKLGWRHVSAAPDLGGAELARLLSDTGAAVLFCEDAAHGPGLPGGPQVITVSRRPAAGVLSLIELTSGGRPVGRHSTQEASLVIWTSGTTGARKGVARGQAGTGPDAAERARLLREYQRDVSNAQPARLHNRTLLTLPMHHGTGPGFAHRALGLAGTVYLLPSFSPIRALELLDGKQITHWAATPWLLHQLRGLPREVLASYDVSWLEVINVGSAAVSAALRRWVAAYFGEGRLVEFYGTTEVGIVASLPPGAEHLKPGSCGLPHRHVEVRAVGPDGAVAGPGAEGELLVRTPQTAAGYVGAGAPEYALDADGFFRTGDIGWTDEDGYLYLSGRADDVITQAGRQVYAAAIEEALAEHPLVLDAAVIGWPDGAADQQVIAFCEVAAGSAVTAADLTPAVSALVPDPCRLRVEVGEALPRTEIGKVIKQALRDRAGAWSPAPPPAPRRAPPPTAARHTPPPAAAQARGWYSREGLDRAWRAVRVESEADLILAPERYGDLASGWEGARDQLLARLRTGQYRPRPARVAAIPKGPLLHRPEPVLDPVDRAVLMAMVQAMQPALAPRIGPEAFGLAPGSQDPGGGQGWLDFERAARKLARAHDPAWGVCADVASFGESVDLSVLADDLLGCGVPADLVADLTGLLRQLGHNGGFWGLPHGQSSSALLGSFYLHAGDAVLRRLGISFVRMQDDILMFGASPARLSYAVAALERELRRRRLVLSAGKTALLPAGAITAQFVPRGRSPREAFTAAIAPDGGSAVRLVRFALARLAAAADDYAASWAIGHLRELPELAAGACGYLRALIPRQPEIALRLGRLLDDAPWSADPFVTLHVLRALRAAAVLPSAARELCWHLLGDDDAEFYVRQEAARCIARQGGEPDGARLAALLPAITDADVAHAVRAAITRIGVRAAAGPSKAASENGEVSY
jgi:long-chain acyl-CoA synthetase